MYPAFNDFKINMSRNILKYRPPASPNKPPPAPERMLPKGQPVPLDINFLVRGSTIQRTQDDQSISEKRMSSAGVTRQTNSRPHSAHVDKHVLESMSRSPSVDSSFYNKFERLDRDTIIGDTAYKEKGGRVKSAGSIRHVTQRPSFSKPRKRSKSASSTSRKCSQIDDTKAKKQTPSRSTGSFFEMAISFDDETQQNTLSNAVRQISPRTLGIEKKTPQPVRRRPRSGRKPRERSLSSKRSDGSDSQSSHSVATRGRCSSAGSRQERHNKKDRSRKSRSRTRRSTPRISDHGNNSKKSSPERKTNTSRSISSARHNQRKKVTSSNNAKHTLLVRKLSDMPTPSCFETFETTERKGDFAYHYTPSPIRKSQDEKSRTFKQKEKGASAIDAVKKANNAKETLKEMKEIDQIMFPEERRYNSKLPKLKMIVAPTALPLASLVRNTSAKMLMTNNYDSKRTF